MYSKLLESQALISLFATILNSSPGALFETRGVTNATKESGVRRQEGRA
jgi:hypothetical protein